MKLLGRLLLWTVIAVGILLPLYFFGSFGLKENIPQTRDPIADVRDHVVFYSGFNNRTVKPSIDRLNDGNGYPPLDFVPAFQPGVYGESLLLPTQGLTYPNVDTAAILGQPGGLALWITPGAAKESDDAPFVNFLRVVSGGSSVTLGRTGRSASPGGVSSIVAVAQPPVGQKVTITFPLPEGWPAGVWRLLAVNWTPSAFEFSVDGMPFTRVPFSGFAPIPPLGIASGEITLGGVLPPAGFYPLLADELLLFSQPLSSGQAATMYREGKKSIDAHP